MHLLPWVMHDVYKAFDASPSLEIIGVFLDLSKAFDRVWNEVLMYKLKCLRICETFHRLMHSFLSDGQQKVTLKGQSLNWSHIESGVS